MCDITKGNCCNAPADYAQRLAEKLIALLDDCESNWRIVAEKQLVIHRLYAEQINVSDKLTKYYEIWRSRDYSTSENIATFHTFTEIDEQMHPLAELLNDFEDRLVGLGKDTRILITKIRIYMADLRKCLESVVKAESTHELQNMEICSLDGLEIPDLPVEYLAQEWEQVQLDARITDGLHQLENLLQHSDGSSGDVSTSDQSDAGVISN